MDAVGPAVAILLALGLLAAFLLAIPAAAGAFDRHRWVERGLALVLTVSAGLLLVHAGQDDGYYGAGVSHWEHGTRFVGTGFLVATMATGILATAGVVGLSLAAGRWRRVGMPLALVASVALLLASFSLSAGH